ncbi:MAG: lactate racemase domain-containing protein [Sedimentisphaerales bacterium]|nr:lactate racemase domain-containing protein [Sedimentisphaerales bacterium]
MIYLELANPSGQIDDRQLEAFTIEALKRLGPRQRVLLIPPDITRIHSRAGLITRYAWQDLGKAVAAVLPAVGTHEPMAEAEILQMFGQMPVSLFRRHNWRSDLVTLGQVPSDFIRQVSEGRLEYPWPAQVNRILVEGGFDLVLSIGQVVPHEVAGMANYNKNIFVGIGGSEGINKSHFLGAVYGMERIMGRADTPVRKVLNYASDHFAKDLPIVYILTVVANTATGPVLKGIFVGDDIECFNRACALAQQVNITFLDRPLEKVIVYLDPHEYKSTWLGNKAIYRTRMAMARDGQLIILAPGLKQFGEDKAIDVLIRKYGYLGTDHVLEAVKKNEDLAANLSAAAHLIHGSTEGRFKVTYCPGYLTDKEILSVGFDYADLGKMLARYDPKKMTDGFNHVDGQEVFFISNPGLGLWATRQRFNSA